MFTIDCGRPVRDSTRVCARHIDITVLLITRRATSHKTTPQKAYFAILQHSFADARRSVQFDKLDKIYNYCIIIIIITNYYE